MQNQSNKKEHELVKRLLPWLVNDSLSAEESDRVETHLQLCEQCCNEVSQLQAVNKHVAEEEPEWQPSSAHFSSILSEVDRLEAVTPKQKKTKQTRNNGWSGFFQNLLQTPTSVRWTLTLETMAIVALLTVWNISPQMGLPLDTELYQTLSDTAKDNPAPDMRRIRLLFNDAMTTAELTLLLQQADVQIRQGPSALGIYIAEVPKQKAKRSLEKLRNHQRIRLAELLQVTP